MTLFDWTVVAFCCSLPFALWAIRRWKIRVRLVREFPQQSLTQPERGRSRLVSEGMPAGASTSASLSAGTAKDSSQREPLVVMPRPKPFLVAPVTCEDFTDEERA